MSSGDDLRAELADVAASLRAYLELQQDTGAMGIPRRPKPRATAGASEAATAIASANAVPTAVRPAVPTAMPTVTPTATATATPTAPSIPTATAPPIRTVTATASPTSPPAKARALPIVAAEVAGCTKCALHATRTNTVFSRGNPDAALCFVGEAPGADEDAQGLPFVGRAGQLLDKMIQAMGLDPAKDVYVCNIIKCRPPGNRRPEPIEIDTCIPYLHEQMAAVKPKVIVAMGNTAVGALLATKMGITKLRGQWKLYRGSTPVMPTYHPSYLIRPSAQQSEAKKQAWEDLQAAMKQLGLEVPKKKG